MINRVGGQLVDGQDDVLGPGFGQACLAGMSLNSCSQCVERTGIERQVQDGDARFGCQVVIGHSGGTLDMGYHEAVLANGSYTLTLTDLNAGGLSSSSSINVQLREPNVALPQPNGSN